MKHPDRLPLIVALLLLAISVPLRADTIYAMGRRYVSIRDVAARYGLTITDQGYRVVLTGSGKRAVLYPDKRQAYFNYVPVSLGFAPLKKGRLYVSQIDLLTTLDPLLNPACVPRHRIYTIVLDPGHGGKDHGGIGARYREKNITLQLAKKVGDLLRRSGYNILYTRSGDQYLTLSQRSAFANARKAQLFLSLHVNATRDKSVTGIETYAISPSGTPSTSAQRADSDRYTGNRYDRYNILLAACIHRKMILGTKAKDRGVKRARFQVLRETNCPAVLLEIGFISNSAEERKLGSDAYLNTLARAIADGVLQYHRTIVKNQ